MVNFPLSEAQDPGFSHWHSLPNRKVHGQYLEPLPIVIVTNTYKPH